MEGFIMASIYFYLFVIVIGFVVMIYGRAKENKNIDLLGKIITSSFILATASKVNNLIPMSWGYLVVLAMLCGWGGDIFLGLKDHPLVEQKNKDKCFAYGLIAFFAGHIFYLVFFIHSFTFVKGQLLLAFVAAIILPLIIFVLNMRGAIHFEGVLLPCMAYGYLLTSLVLVTFFIAINLYSLPGVILLVSAILFITSDLILMIIYFGDKPMNKKQFFYANFFNLLTYFIAQYGFVTLPLYLSKL